MDNGLTQSDDLIPNQLTHEADGLILQPADAGYVPLHYYHYEYGRWTDASERSID